MNEITDNLLAKIISFVPFQLLLPLLFVNKRWKSTCRGILKKKKIKGKIFCTFAATRGYLSLLQWAKNNGCPWNNDVLEGVPYEAAKNGHLDLLKWTVKNGGKTDYTTDSAAAIGGRLDILQWLLDNGSKFDEYTARSAARHGQLKALKWLKENGCPWDAYTCQDAAGGGHLDVLKFAKKNGCEWDEMTSIKAAEGGHLEILQWARENGCDWNNRVAMAAARFGHFHVLKWAIENGCPFFRETCLIAGYHNKEIVDWLNLQPEFKKRDQPLIHAEGNSHDDPHSIVSHEIDHETQNVPEEELPKPQNVLKRKPPRVAQKTKKTFN